MDIQSQARREGGFQATDRGYGSAGKSFKTIATGVFLGALLVMGLAADASAGDLTWKYRAPLPYGDSVISGGSLGGKLYVIGGNQPANSTTVYVYDPSTDAWTARRNMITGRQSPAVAVVGATLYAIGGGSTGSYFDKTEAYDPVSNTWTTMAAMPTARWGSAAAVISGTLYVIGGGYGVGSDSNVVQAYYPASNTWATKANLPAARWGLAAATVGATIYAIGGDSSGYKNDCWAYDPATNTWATMSPMPTARAYAPIAAVLGGKIYVCAGANDSGYPKVVEVYDPVTNAWTTETSVQSGHGWAAGGAVNGKIYVVGGQDPALSALVEEGSLPEAPSTGGYQAPAPPSEALLYVYPHPLKCPGGKAVFKMEKAGTATLRILNMRGKVMKELSRTLGASPAAEIFIDCNDVKNGAYLLNGEIAYGDGSKQTLKPFKFVVAGKR